MCQFREGGSGSSHKRNKKKDRSELTSQPPVYGADYVQDILARCYNDCWHKFGRRHKPDSEAGWVIELICWIVFTSHDAANHLKRWANACVTTRVFLVTLGPAESVVIHGKITNPTSTHARIRTFSRPSFYSNVGASFLVLFSDFDLTWLLVLCLVHNRILY